MPTIYQKEDEDKDEKDNDIFDDNIDIGPGTNTMENSNDNGDDSSDVITTNQKDDEDKDGNDFPLTIQIYRPQIVLIEWALKNIRST